MGREPPYTLGDEFLGDTGMQPRTRDRALDAMEAAGLIRVERHRGRLPRVWLTAAEQGGASRPVLHSD